MIKAVIFDVDGLMFDTEPLFSKVQVSIAEKRGKIFTPEIKHKMMGTKQIDGVKILLNELGIKENPETVLQEYVDSYKELIKKEIQPMPGLFELLDFLEIKNIRKAVATSSMREWIDVIFDKLNLSSRFEFITTAEECERGKPDPEIYNKSTKRLGLNSSDCLVLEDSPNGIKAAKEAGCIAVAIPNEFTKGQDLSRADLIVERLDNQKLFDFILKIR